MMLVILLRRMFQLIVEALINFSSIILRTKATPFHSACLRILGSSVNGKVFIGRNVIIFNHENLVLGNRIAIPDNSHISCHDIIEIGDDFIAAPGLYINSGSHDMKSMKGTKAKIKIGRRVWCGMRVTICSGVEIGDDVVIGAGAIVTKSIPSNTFAAGVPAYKKGDIDRNQNSFQQVPI